MIKPTILMLSCLLTGLCSYAQSDSLYVLDLEQCVNIAIENNLSVRRSTLSKESSQIGLTQSKASRLPSVNLGANSGYNWGRSIDPRTNAYISQQIQTIGFNGGASVVLFNWFRLTNTVRQSRMNYESAEYDVEKAKNDVSLNIVTFYVNVIFTKELLENAKYQLQSSEEQLERTKKLVAGGALPRTNELELISQVATNEVNVINAQNDLNLALLNLKQAMLIPTSQAIEIIVPDLDVDQMGLDVTPEDVYLTALNNMPEIKSAERQVESAVYAVKVAEAGYSPTLNLNGNFSTNYSDAFQQFNPNLDNPFVINTDGNGNPITTSTFYQTSNGVPVEQVSVTNNGSYETVAFRDQLDQNLSKSITLSLSIPIFNGLQAKSSVQNAKINLQISEITVMEQKNALRQTIESAYNDAFSASKVYGASLKQVEALEETFRSVANQYNLGASNFTDYQVASNNLFAAKSDLVRAKFDYIFKLKILDFYQGKSISL